MNWYDWYAINEPAITKYLIVPIALFLIIRDGSAVIRVVRGRRGDVHEILAELLREFSGV